MRMNYWITAMAVGGTIFCGTAFAAEIYQWRDALGQLQFSDNPARVPAKLRDSAARDINALPATSSRGVSLEEGKWNVNCAACHHTGEYWAGDLLGLGSYTQVDPVTRFRKLPEDLLPLFQKSLAEKSTHMEPITLPDSDVLAIARYLLQKQEKQAVAKASF